MGYQRSPCPDAVLISVMQESLAREGQVVAPQRTEAKEEITQAAQEDKEQRYLQYAGPDLLHPRQPALADCPPVDM